MRLLKFIILLLLIIIIAGEHLRDVISVTMMTPAGEDCPVCLDSKQLRVVPCSNRHCFCEDCLQTLTDSQGPQGAVPCPLCRQPFTVPPQGVSAFPVHQPIRLPDIRRQREGRTLRSYSAIWRRGASDVTPTPSATRPERTTSGDVVQEMLQQVRPRDSALRRDTAQQTRQRARDLQRRDESIARRLQW